jgi:hypothetical protein
MFTKYQTLDADVLDDLDDVTLDDSDFTTLQREKYKEIMKKHYQNLTYKIKDEKIDGDTATVTVEIEVFDYSKILTAANTYLQDHPDIFKNPQGDYDAETFNDYRLEQLSKAEETIKYTLDMRVIKTNGKWRVDALDELTQDKINGVYVY